MLDSATLTELTASLPYLDERERAELDRLLATVPPKFSKFVRDTFAFPLFEWQEILCDRLEQLSYQTGQRILIHAAPQTGKSLVVSQRLPAYLIGCNPATRVKLACYNVTHATRFSKINLQLMQEPVYEAMFPNPGARLAYITQEEWTTAARAAVRDAQPSFAAVGLRTGMVGTGSDVLLIDDPYSSPAEAFSEVINNGVWDFWQSAAKVRLHEDANVVVMFHRYHTDDLAGRMYAEGGWEMWRFPAVGDDNPQMPDRMPRSVGEPLTPRLTPAFIAEQQRVPSVWLGQFQGLPVAAGGNIFKRYWFHYYAALPELLEVWSVSDTALKDKQQNDETANLIMGLGVDGNLYILRVTHGHWETPDFARFLVSQAEWLRRTYGDRYKGDYIEDKVSGTTLMQYVRRSSPQTILIGVSADSDKVARAHGVTPVVEAGRVHLPDPAQFPQAAAWVRYFLDQVTSFPGGLDDVLDCLVYALKRFLGTLKTTGSRKGKSGGYLG